MMPEESWRRVPGASLYEVSSHGRVRSWNRCYNLNRDGLVIRRRAESKLLVTHVRPDGYVQIKITYDDRVKRTKPLHRLVLQAFLGPPPEGWTASHMNHDPSDNRIENLTWEPLSVNVKRQAPARTRGRNVAGLRAARRTPTRS
jgi:hypothetical protein